MFADLPAADLVEICRQVQEIHMKPGDVLFHQGETGQHAYVIIDGRIEIYKIAGGQRVQLAIRGPGDVIGEMSLVDDIPRNASGVALTDCVIVTIPRAQIDYMLRTNPTAARIMLHTIIARLHANEATLLQKEKMAQLGSFVAGIAHEINNPTAAAQRGAEQLKSGLEDYIALNLELYGWLSTPAAINTYRNLRLQIHARVQAHPQIDAAARIDREEALEAWLNEQNVPDGWALAGHLVELDYSPANLSAATAPFPREALPLLLRWMTAEADIQQLVDEIHMATGRIADIVRALKNYIHLDQAPQQEIDVHEGLENTLVILRHKLKRGIEVVRQYDRAVSRISAYASELNQVWTNLIDNAIDAIEESTSQNDGHKGRITLRTGQEGERVFVEVEDTGVGIDPENLPRLFYPFFSTKPVGQGTGLGLNISNRIVQKHGGEIVVTSQPGQTRFKVLLPVKAPPPPPIF